VGFRTIRIGIIALFLARALTAQQGHDYTPADVEAGSRYYANYCAGCHGADGQTISNANLSRGTFRRAANDEELARIITNGLPGTAMPPAAFQPVQVSQIVAFLRELPSIRSRQTSPGDAARGLQIFESKGACLNCHRVSGRGARFGPDLTEIGALRRPAEIEQSLVDPGAVVLSQNRVVAVSTRDGKTIRGRLLNQDTTSIQMLGPDERPVSIARSTLLSIVDEKDTMPSYKDRLDARELADVVSYLVSLRGLK
jgi:putative heme-binding domain-containing protein